MRKPIVVFLSLLGVVVAIFASVVYYQEITTVRMAPALRLSEALEDACLWRISRDGDGVRVQVHGSRYHGWYLDADTRLKQKSPSGSHESGRFVVVSERRRPSSVWKVIPEADGKRLTCTAGPFQGRNLDIGGVDPSEGEPGRRRSANLIIGEAHFEWKLKETSQGTMIQATRLEYTDWYLGVDPGVTADRYPVDDPGPSPSPPPEIQTLKRARFR